MSVPFPPGRDVEAWQVAVWNADDGFLSRPQRLALMQMLDASFNAFDGFAVVRSLIENRPLWDTALMCQGFPTTAQPASSMWHLHADLITLRDLARHWNVDTLYLLHEQSNTAALERLAAGWSADEIDPVPADAVGPLLGAFGVFDQHSILRVWWD